MIAYNMNEGGIFGPEVKLQNLSGFIDKIFTLSNNRNRVLQLNAMETLEAFSRRYPSQFAAQAKQIYTQLESIISRDDIVKAAHALAIATNLIAKCDIAGSEKCWMKAAEFAGHEGIDSEQSTVIALNEFFSTVCAKKDIGAGVINCLKKQISLQARAAVRGVAIISNSKSGAAQVAEF